MVNLTSSTSSFRAKALYLAAAAMSIYALLFAVDLIWTSRVVLGQPWSEASRMARFYEVNDPTEIPVIGPSYALRSYLADTLGQQYYVYGKPGANLQVLSPILHAEFSRQRTTPIIIDFYENMLRDRPERKVDVRAFIPLVQQPGVNEVLEVFDQNRFHFQVPGLRYFGQYSDYWSDYKRQENLKTQNYFCNGGTFFLPVTPNQDFRGYLKQRSILDQPFIVDTALEAEFSALLASRPDREIVLVVSPHHKSAYPGTVNLNKMGHYLDSLSASMPHVHVLLFDGSDYPDDHFKDSIHLNYLGAKRFSSQLRKKLDELGLP